MKGARVHAIDRSVIRGLPLQVPEKYYNRCTQSLEIKIIDGLIRFVKQVIK